MEGSKYLGSAQGTRIFKANIAATLGVNEAIFISQLDYWLHYDGIGTKVDGATWVYNTINEWHTQFCWLSVPTIKRMIAGLETKGIIITRYMKGQRVKVKMYRIDYARLDSLVDKYVNNHLEKYQFDTIENK